MENKFSIRLIRETDAAACLDIYSPYVLETCISFEYDLPSPEEFLDRIKTSTVEYPWLVCEFDQQIIGYAYASKHRYRTAYQWSTEASIYLRPEFHKKGIARILYGSLFSMLKLQGYYNVFAGIGLPNDKSVDFHRSIGFVEIAIFNKVGYKHGEWHDTQWSQLILTPHISEPSTPLKMTDVIDLIAFKEILVLANTNLKVLNQTI